MLGSQGMPRRYYDYQPEFQIYHVISTIGAYIMACGFFLCAACFVQSLLGGKKAPANPWGGRSLEWQCTSPPPHDNFSSPPTVGNCYDFSMLRWDEKEQGYVVDKELEAVAIAAEARGHS